MFENTDLATALATITNLEGEVSRLSNVQAFLSADITRKHNEKQALKRHLEAYLEEEGIEIEDGTDLEALCSMLDIYQTKEVTFTVTASWHVTATLDRNQDPTEWADEQSWGAELTTDAELEYQSPDAEMEVEPQAD